MVLNVVPLGIGNISYTTHIEYSEPSCHTQYIHELLTKSLSASSPASSIELRAQPTQGGLKHATDSSKSNK